MADTIKLPGIGLVKKEYAYAAVGGVVLIGGVVYYRNRQAANAVAVGTTTDDTGELDPATGYDYGTAEDTAALSAQAAYTPVGDGYSGATGSDGQTVTNITPVTYATNPQWSQAAEEYLTTSIGAPSADVSEALGKYLTGANVVIGSADESYIHQAIAAEGQPPQQGANGYPPSIRTVAASTATTTTVSVADGYYRDMITGAVYEVYGGKRWHITPTEWANVASSAKKYSNVSSTWAGYKLALQSGVGPGLNNTAPSKPVAKPAPVKAAPKPVAKAPASTVTLPSQVNQYTIYHDTKTGAYYDVNPSKKTVHKLTSTQLAADLKAGAKTVNSNGAPTYSTGKLTFK